MREKIEHGKEVRTAEGIKNRRLGPRQTGKLIPAPMRHRLQSRIDPGPYLLHFGAVKVPSRIHLGRIPGRQICFCALARGRQRNDVRIVRIKVCRRLDSSQKAGHDLQRAGIEFPGGQAGMVTGRFAVRAKSRARFFLGLLPLGAGSQQNCHRQDEQKHPARRLPRAEGFESRHQGQPFHLRTRAQTVIRIGTASQSSAPAGTRRGDSQ